MARGAGSGDAVRLGEADETRRRCARHGLKCRAVKARAGGRAAEEGRHATHSHCSQKLVSRGPPAYSYIRNVELYTISYNRLYTTLYSTFLP